MIRVVAFTVILTSSLPNIVISQEKDIDYLGQQPPGAKAELFFNGALVKHPQGERRSFNVVFSPKGDEMFFSYYKATTERPSPEYEIKTYKRISDEWVGPETASFSGHFWDVDISFSPDGNYIFFSSDRPQPNSANSDIYYCIRLADGWSDPIYAGVEVNSSFGEVYPSISEKNSLFFRSSRPGGYGDDDLYRADWVNGNFVNVKNLGPNINTSYGESNAVIATDESYIVFCSSRPDGNHRQQIYVSFQTGDNIWTKAVPLGAEVNTMAEAGAPSLTPDGKYLIFKKSRVPDRGLYWVSTTVIEELRPD